MRIRVDIQQKIINIDIQDSIKYVTELCKHIETYLKEKEYASTARSYSRSRSSSYFFSGDAESKDCDERVARTLAKYGSNNIGDKEFIAACLVSGVDPSSIDKRDLDYIQHLLNEWT